MEEKKPHPSYERLVSAASAAGITDREDLATLLGQTTFTISNWVKRGVSRDGALAAQDKLGVSSLWILHGKIDVRPISSPVRKSDAEAPYGMIKNKPDELVIPQFNSGGSMGSGLLLRDQPGIIQSWHVSQEWVIKNIKSHTGSSNLCIVTGFGDSMKGMFNSGDPLVVDLGVRSVDFDAIYFFRVGEEGFVKRLQRIPGEGIRVLSENKQYDSWSITRDMDFEVFGRVVKAWQGENF
jgi:hypothetical protein